jgi:hypothetical protein
MGSTIHPVVSFRKKLLDGMLLTPAGVALYQLLPPSVVRRTSLLFSAQPLFTSIITRDCIDGELTTGKDDMVGAAVGAAGEGVSVDGAGADGSVGARVVGVGVMEVTGPQASRTSKSISPPDRILRLRECIQELL